MMRRRFAVLPILLLAAAALPGAAPAAFPAPAQLAEGAMLGATAAVDASGDGVVIATGVDGGPRLFERSGPVAPWSAGAKLPGRDLGGATGPVVAAAGAGAAVAAWRNDTPHRYQSIVAMVRDPGGGVWSAPATVSGDDANGVRHPAAAIDARGDAVLAYNSNTRTAHLSMMGAVTVALRVPGAGFGRPVVVDEVPKAAAPAVAIGPDGRGLVAWIRNRQIWAVDVDAVAGTVGKMKALSPKGRWGLLHVAAGPGATATVVARGASGADTVLYAVRRPADGSFAGRRFQVLQRFTHKGQTTVLEVAVGADDTGRTTVAWAPLSFGSRANGFTAGIRFAVAGEGSTSFSRARDLVPQRTLLDCTSPSVAAAAGRTAIAWVCTDRKTYTFQTALINSYNITGPTTVATSPGVPPSYYAQPSVIAGLDSTGTTTLTITRPDPLQPRTPTTERLFTTTGR